MDFGLAPDGSEIRPLVSVPNGSMVHCTLRPGSVSRAVRHPSLQEVWVCTAGRGQMWRALGTLQEIVELAPGMAVSIPEGVSFQFRATGADPLEVVITTMPPWPGAHGAEPVDGAWEPTA
jgi:mannose-6-phosphate isomerase-like protein (cupin superfamily)